MMPTQRDLDEIVGRVTTFYDTTTIYLFGSQAKGLARPRSDIDLLIVGPSRLPRSHRGREVAAALAAFPWRFTLLFYTDAELAEERRDPLSLIANALGYARILYQRPQPSSPTNDQRLATTDNRRSPLGAGAGEPS